MILRLSRPVVLGACLGTGLGAARLAHASDLWTDPYPGVRHLHRTTDDPMLLDVVVIDTSFTELVFRATAAADRGRTTSGFADLYDADVAWNGDLFRPLG